jgi:hypothetical protein
MLPEMAMTSHNVGTVHPEAGAAFEELVERFHIDNPTFRISDDVIRRYYLATTTRGFVILCGPSGTGKTWLAQAYANVIGARQKLVAVDPSWSSNEDLLGYLSPLDGFYHHTPFSEFVADSAREWNASNQAGRVAREFHVILDEMNLARVEHYFSRFLSAMEVRTREGIARLDLAPGHTVELTPNLKFSGTVNIDETTHGFADKVYDRAQILELPLPREMVAAHMADYPLEGHHPAGLGRAGRGRAVRVPRARRDQCLRRRGDRDRHRPHAGARRAAHPEGVAAPPWRRRRRPRDRRVHRAHR